jgi:hypothetical protein
MVEDLWFTYRDASGFAEAKTTPGNALNSDLFHPTPQKEPSDFDQ